MATEIATYNLERDKKVLGKEWFSTYGGWFSDEDNISLFIKAVRPLLPDTKLDILYPASASGLLGERLLQNLGRGTLTLVDISQKHLNENTNPKTKKVCADLLEMSLGKKFDVIMMRSSLDYFPSRLLQVAVLKLLKKHLKEGGVFINQPAYIADPRERDVVSAAYTDCDKLGSRLFQSSDMQALYVESGFGIPKKIGAGRSLILTEQDHISRYGLMTDDVLFIQKFLKEHGCASRVTKSGYTLTFEFPIYAAQ